MFNEIPRAIDASLVIKRAKLTVHRDLRTVRKMLERIKYCQRLSDLSLGCRISARMLIQLIVVVPDLSF